jgi:hypothetical protein
MSAEVKIIVSGPVGSGKSALLGEIEIMLKALGVPVRYEDEAGAQAEKNGNHADWTAELEMYKPSVVLVEDMQWLRKDSAALQAQQGGDLHAAIMNLPAKPDEAWPGGEQHAYKFGHRDARHAAAELVAAQQGEANAPAPFTADDVTQEFTLDTIVSGLLHDCEHGPDVWRAALDEYIRVERNLAAVAAPALATLSDQAVLTKMRELEPNWNAYGGSRDSAVNLCITSVRALLTAAGSSQEDAKDAARYRWLRDPENDIAFVIDKPVMESVNPFGDCEVMEYEYRSGQELDEAIDAALAAKEANK